MSTPEIYQFASCIKPILLHIMNVIKCLFCKSTVAVINEKMHCGTEIRASQNCKDVQNDILYNQIKNWAS